MRGSGNVAESTTTFTVPRSAYRRFVMSTVIDAIGSGLWMPFALLFLVHGRGFSLVETGAALTVGGMIGLASVPVVGAAADRFGLTRVLQAGNIVRLVAFLCYPLVHSGWQVVVVAAAVGIGDRLFWTVNAPLITALTDGRDAEKLIGTQTIARFAGAGIGAAAAAVLPAVAGAGMYTLLALGNAASFALAALLVIGLRVPERRQDSGEPAAPRVSWLALLRHRAYVGYCATHVLYTLASVSKFTMLPLVVFDVLHGPQWIPGAAILVSTVVIVLGQRPIIAYVRRWSRGTALVVSSAIFTVSFALLALLTRVPIPVATVMILLYAVAVSIAEAVFAPVTTAAAAAAAPPRLEGRASALFQLSWGISQVISPLLLTSLLDIGNTTLWLVVAALCALTVPAVLRLRRTLPTGTLD
jgi:MFS family permease